MQHRQNLFRRDARSWHGTFITVTTAIEVRLSYSELVFPRLKHHLYNERKFAQYDLDSSNENLHAVVQACNYTEEPFVYRSANDFRVAPTITGNELSVGLKKWGKKATRQRPSPGSRMRR